jgi:hypothetical protein
MKILFLDIDGVVNCKDTFTQTKRPGPYPLDSYMAFLVGRIQLETGCKVVLSSAWRLHPEGIQNVSERVVELLDITPSVKWDGVPKFARGHWWKNHELRGDEINAWLEKHPEVEKYAILDDSLDFYDNQPLFRTTWEKGLTDEIAEQVIQHLGRV